MKFKEFDIQLVIFDLDGTLIDSTWIWTKIDEDFFKRRNMEVPEDYGEKIAHIGLEKAAEVTKSLYGIKESEQEIIKEWTDASINMYKYEIPLKKGGKDILDYFKKNHVKIALATANDASLYMPCLERLNIKDYFDEIIDVKKAGVGKDNPLVYLKISNKYSIKPENTLVFEDVLTGLKTACNSGFITIGVEDQQSVSTREEKIKYSKIYINSFLDLL